MRVGLNANLADTQLWKHPLWIVPELCLCISIAGFAKGPYEPHVMRLHRMPTVRGEVQLHSPVFTGITHCNDAFCVCVKMSIQQQENEMFSRGLHTLHKVFHPPNQMSVWIQPLGKQNTTAPGGTPSSSPLFILCEIQAKPIICVTLMRSKIPLL